MSKELETTFHKYAKYGDPKAPGHEMSGKNFAKLCKECNILENGCTSADVDVVFSKVKSKGARVINFSEFQDGLKQLSRKRFQGMGNALPAIHKLVEGKDPESPGSTKTVAVGAVDRLTDISKYGGTHKERFNESGKGASGSEEVTHDSGHVEACKGKEMKQ
ncbi:tubulin polymerization-promoting protein family member 2-like [Spea bombifrons]|uniref:tubulin polymerization-promoting protein family member 2-like n=1 Tax=Spea bombifrons TaxID=233779 RepID=UPI00234906BA|nr:tubulin polymerization-promoting protein family member 2-like [Spea bombifrons]